MLRNSRFHVTLLTFFLIAFFAKGKEKGKNQRVILISLDGFRWDYLDKMKDYLPNLNKFKSAGVSVEYVKNVFPTNTLPNHVSIVTGLYPENHGVIDNTMYDPDTGKEFDIASNDSFWWGWAEPIWISNQRQGHRSAVIYYPGYDVTFNNLKPSYSTAGMPYGKPFASGDNIMPLKKRVDLAINWLRHDPKLNFVALYMEQIDSKTHDLSPDDIQNEYDRASAFREVDNALDYLMKSLVLSKLQDTVNIIVIGDHGQTDVNDTTIIDLTKFFNPKKYISHSKGMTDVFIYPLKNKTFDLYKKLKGAHQHMTVYLRNEIPADYHIKNCNRTAPLLLLAEPGWLINTTFEALKYQQGRFIRGEHGYSNSVLDMNSGFVAWGPCFHESKNIKTFESVDVYSAICRILGIRPSRNDGDHGQVNINSSNVIRLNKYLNPRAYIRKAFGATAVFVYPMSGVTDKIYEQLKDINSNMAVYHKDNIPEEYHVKKCNRTSALLLLATPGWFIDSDFNFLSYPPGRFLRGEHGYSSDYRDMNPGFVAWGPSFKAGAKVTSIETVDAYSMMCSILGLKESHNNGDFTRVKPLMADAIKYRK